MRDGEAARLCGCSELAMAVCLQVRQADRSNPKASIGTHCSPPPMAADILLIGGYLLSGEVRYEYCSLLLSGCHNVLFGIKRSDEQ